MYNETFSPISQETKAKHRGRANVLMVIAKLSKPWPAKPKITVKEGYLLIKIY
jgi:hypothetical protein